MHGWVCLLFTWIYHNIVNWLYPNTKCFGVKKIFFLIKKERMLQSMKKNHINILNSFCEDWKKVTLVIISTQV